jgi:hypothetical protein
MSEYFGREERLLITRGFKYVPGSSHNRPHSSDLFAQDHWRAATESELAPLENCTVVSQGFTRFRLNANTLEKLKVLSAPERSSSGIIEVDLSLLLEVAEHVRIRTGHVFTNLSTKVVLLESDGLGNVSGTTTNGLHFDTGEAESSVRIGVNLGPIPRRVIFVPVSRDEIHQQLSTKLGYTLSASDEYKSISQLDLPVYAHRIDPGEGWTMTTATRLHDGRRAYKDGKSRFILIRAQ